jgi:ribokinase
MPNAVVLGDINVDVIAHYPAFPVPGQDSFATDTAFCVGGVGANTAIALATLGVKTELVARLGLDPWATIACRSLTEAGVGLDALQHDRLVMTGSMYVVVTPDGERTILGHRGANVFTDPCQIRKEMFESASLLYLSGYALLAEPQRTAALLALDMARHQGLTVALDPGLSGDSDVAESLLSLLPSIDILLPNMTEAKELAQQDTPEDCARMLLASGAGLVALKLGPDGCLICEGNSILPVPGFDVQARDSTGAGDSFAGGLLTAHLASLDWYEAGILANAMGALTSSRIGAGGSAPTASALLAFLVQSAQNRAKNIDHGSLGRVIDFVKTLAL